MSKPNDESTVRIQTAIKTMKERVKDDRCPRCGAPDWSYDLVHIPATSERVEQSKNSSFGVTREVVRLSSPDRSTETLSFLSIVCKKCGYAIFHDLKILEPPQT
jgi:predicted nucleic-acid-binding Zn-ribbon protein